MLHYLGNCVSNNMKIEKNRSQIIISDHKNSTRHTNTLTHARAHTHTHTHIHTRTCMNAFWFVGCTNEYLSFVLQKKSGWCDVQDQ